MAASEGEKGYIKRSWCTWARKKFSNTAPLVDCMTWLGYVCSIPQTSNTQRQNITLPIVWTSKQWDISNLQRVQNAMVTLVAITLECAL